MPDPRDEVIERFANAPPERDPPANVPSIRELTSTVDRVIGAQKVAVYRDDSEVLRKLKILAGVAGPEWYYRFPVKNKKENRVDYIEGPSIKLANDLSRIYGNCDVDCRVVDIGKDWLFYARFTDFESGFSLTRPFMQSKSGSRLGGADDNRRLEIAMAIGTSKAQRNVVVNALQTFADFAFEEAKNSLIEKIGAKLPEWRKKVSDRLAGLNVDPKRVELVIGRVAADWLAGDVAKIVGMMKAVQDGMATLDETFPPVEVAESQPASDKVSEFAKTSAASEGEGPSGEGTSAPDTPPSPADAYTAGVADRDAGKPLRRPDAYADDAPMGEAWEAGWKTRDGELAAALRKPKK